MLFSPASRGFSVAWLLAFTKSFARLIRRVVGLFTPRELRDRQATGMTLYTLKAMQERNLCSQGNVISTPVKQFLQALKESI